MQVVIVGAGAGGIAMGTLLKRAGFDDFTILERSDGVGGTWHDNRYPGAGCDVPSHLYCFSFAPKPDWQQKFALQPEIEAYFQSCVERHDLARHIRFGTEVVGARFDEADGVWHVRTAAGEELVANVLISGTGQLNRPHVPALPGLDAFAGARFHSARWDPAFDAAGKSIVVVGSGASAVQFVPQLQKTARRVTLLQRSPPFVLPRKDRRYRGFEKWMFQHVPLLRRFYRSLIYWQFESRFPALYRGSLTGKIVRWMALRYMRSVVTDPALRAKLTPDYPIGCKRILISDDWFEALIEKNVEVVTSPIAEVTRDAVVTADGAAHPADALVLATGFATTGFLAPMEIVGRGGIALTDAWRDGAEAHHGVAVSGFPNLFLLYGPNTNLGHNSILFMLECQARYIVRCLRGLVGRAGRWLEVRRDAMARSNAVLQKKLARTTWGADCHSWYKTESGKLTNNWSSRTARYWWITRKPDLDEFEIVTRTPTP
jgi:cation diffusion facilitator CzcD-associated flavoprotein CzcO